MGETGAMKTSLPTKSRDGVPGSSRPTRIVRVIGRCKAIVESVSVFMSNTMVCTPFFRDSKYAFVKLQVLPFSPPPSYHLSPPATCFLNALNVVANCRISVRPSSLICVANAALCGAVFTNSGVS